MESYIINEIQYWNRDGNIAVVTPIISMTVRDGKYETADRMALKARFHTQCSLAAISTCDVQTVQVLDKYGNVWEGCHAVFDHPQEQETIN